jgi:hypothetical protein
MPRGTAEPDSRVHAGGGRGEHDHVSGGAAAVING